jgi:flavin reductase (DIM6/NTAB) family NADH-FMN oxidoreductase RutF
MPGRFKTIKPGAIRDNVFKLIGHDWMLVTAGDTKSWNTMTASWGGLGILWNKPVAFAFVRPTRHTYGFMERADRFTLSFFTEKYRRALTFCGTHSGRDCDKAAKTGLTPFAPISGTTSFEQARLILVCRKLYTTDIDPKRFLDPKTDRNYPKKDYHRLSVGEIVRCLTKPAALAPSA